MPNEDIDATLEEVIDRLRVDGSIPGLAIAVVDRDGPVVDQVHGWADIANGRLVEPATPFEIGSIGKTFAAVVVMQLAEEGRLDLDDPVVRHLPWFAVPRTGARITIHHLLSHTAGITAGVDGTPEGTFQVWHLRDLAPGAEPGRRYHYSNVGYKVLGLVIEALEGAPFAEVLRRRILDPLGMTESEPAITNELRSRLAVGYEAARDDRVFSHGAPLLPATWLETSTADGSVVATARDLAKFAQVFLREGRGPDGPLLTAASIERMAAPVPALAAEGYGYGLYSREVDGQRYVGHGGGMVGFLAAMQCDPDAGLAAVVLQNGPGHGPNALARLAIRIVRASREGRDPGAEAGRDLPPEPVAAYVGEYTGPDGRRAIFADDAGVLTLTDETRTMSLESFGDGWFIAPDPSWDRALLWFEPGTNAFWYGADRFVRIYTRAPTLAAPPDALREIVGHYRSHDPWTPNFRVILRGDVPWLMFPAAPDGFDEEQPLVPFGRGGFRVGSDPLGPERLRFDTVIDGHARRATLSGYDYYRVGDP